MILRNLLTRYPVRSRILISNARHGNDDDELSHDMLLMRQDPMGGTARVLIRTCYGARLVRSISCVEVWKRYLDVTVAGGFEDARDVARHTAVIPFMDAALARLDARKC